MMIRPHGGKLINRILDERVCDKLEEQFDEMPKLLLDPDQKKDLRNIATGVFSPLKGFLTQNDFLYVLEHGRLANDIAWTIPIVLDINPDKNNHFEVGDDVLLIDSQDKVLGVLHSEEIYRFDKKNMAEKVFKTTNKDHPGVREVYEMNDYLLGGKIEMVKCDPEVYPYVNLTPKETRILFKTKKWEKIVAFQTRNPPHIGHEYIQKTALTFMDGIFINPVVGNKKCGDFRDDVIISCYKELIKQYYLKDSAVFSIFETQMRYAGPKEAIYHAIARKNFGCTHMIIGRDHAGVGNYYGSYDAHKIFNEYPDLKIEPLFFRSFYRCKKCGSVVNEKICPHPEKYHVNFSGTKIRHLIKNKKGVPADLMRPEITKIIFGENKPFVE
ncbi:MAG: sulfate adenylyltransferase [Candidatus Lokiarchaeota archaeon]|nr:sulfate adenylyltransferase [Candidatus Lokiarchaeota archaeon]